MLLDKSDCVFRNLAAMAISDVIKTEENNEKVLAHLIQKVLTDKQIADMFTKDDVMMQLINSSESPLNGFIGDMLSFSNKLFKQLTYDEKIKYIKDSNYIQVGRTSEEPFLAEFVRVDDDNKEIIIIKKVDNEYNSIGFEFNININWINTVEYWQGTQCVLLLRHK